MHPSVRVATAGRIGYPVNYEPNEHVMPPPPQHAKEIHESVNFDSTADPLGKRHPIKWKTSGVAREYPKFGRSVSHMRLDNICTMETNVNDPKVRSLQCWYLPKIKKEPRLPGAKVEDPPKMFKIHRPSRFFARPDIWGAWNISTEVPSVRERERLIRRASKDDRKNSEKFYEKHHDSISALRRMQKRGEKLKKTDDVQVYIDCLRKRKEDIEAVLNLDALSHTLKYFDGWDSASGIGEDDQRSICSH